MHVDHDRIELDKCGFSKYIQNKEELLGSGGFGRVYKVITTDSPSQTYALKVINFDRVTQIYLQESPAKTPRHRSYTPGHLKEVKFQLWESLLKEAEIMSKLHHKNIIKLVHYHVEYKLSNPKNLYLLLEYSPYGTLLKYIRSKPNKRLPEFISREIMVELLDALVYLADKSIIHGDIKSANVLIFLNGEIKLCDFGLSFQWDDENSNDYNDAINKDDNEKLQNIITNGSAYWLAPEIILHRMATPKSDIWSLGATLIEMLTGDPPFSNFGPLTACHAVGSGKKIQYPGGISKDCRLFLDCCLQYDPIKRSRAKRLLETSWIKQAKRDILDHIDEFNDDNEYSDLNIDGLKLSLSKTTSERTKKLALYREKEDHNELEDADFSHIVDDDDIYEFKYKNLKRLTLLELQNLPTAESLQSFQTFDGIYVDTLLGYLQNDEHFPQSEEILRIGVKYLAAKKKQLHHLCYNQLLVRFAYAKNNKLLSNPNTIPVLQKLIIDVLQHKDWLYITGLLAK